MSAPFALGQLLDIGDSKLSPAVMYTLEGV